MPTTRLKNAAYRLMLPFCAPSCSRHPVTYLSGHELVYRRDFEHLLRKHHVLGSAVLLNDGFRHSLICSSSQSPDHQAVPATYFRVASITKTATAVLAMKLVDHQILDLDCPVGSMFCSASAESVLEGITLSHLLSHTSGLADPPDLESKLEAGIPFADFLPAVRLDEPGRSFRYSNLGFGLIGCVMEAALDQPVGRIFRERLFEPLGMNATLEGCLLPSDRIMPVTRILPYHKGRETVLTRLGSVPLHHPDPLRHYGYTAGSMYTDISSLHKLLNELIPGGNGFLSDSGCRLMQAQHASYGKISPTLTYGYGLLRINDPFLSESTVLGHQGFAYGCADGAFWEENSGRILIMLNGGSSEARHGRLGLLNRDLLRWAFRKELPSW